MRVWGIRGLKILHRVSKAWYNFLNALFKKVCCTGCSKVYLSVYPSTYLSTQSVDLSVYVYIYIRLYVCDVSTYTDIGTVYIHTHIYSLHLYAENGSGLESNTGA